MSIIVLVVIIPLVLGLLLCLRSPLITFILVPRAGENQHKSFHRNEVSGQSGQIRVISATEHSLLVLSGTTPMHFCFLSRDSSLWG